MGHASDWPCDRCLQLLATIWKYKKQDWQSNSVQHSSEKKEEKINYRQNWKDELHEWSKFSLSRIHIHTHPHPLTHPNTPTHTDTHMVVFTCQIIHQQYLTRSCFCTHTHKVRTIPHKLILKKNWSTTQSNVNTNMCKAPHLKVYIWF